MNFWRKLRNRQKLDEELSEEIAAHLAMKQARLEAEGLTASEAERQARMAFGNRTAWKESVREQWMVNWLESLWQDIRYGVRVLRKDKVFTTVALVTIALGIGANTAVFSLLNGLLWRALPVAKPEELVRIRVTNLPPTDKAWINGKETAARERLQIPHVLYNELGRKTELFAGVFGMAGHGDITMDVDGVPHRARMSTVTGTFFPVLGVTPEAGRFLDERDDHPGGPEGGWGVVISDSFWERVFQRRENAIGTKVMIERVPFTVVGVAPRSFQGAHPGYLSELYIPLSSFEAMFPDWKWRTDVGSWSVQTMARLQPGMTLKSAQAQLSAMSRGFMELINPPGVKPEDLEHHLAMKLEAVEGRSGYSWLVKSFGPALWMLMVAVGAVLLIAATNLTNLLLARSTARRQEMSLRLALGAAAGRVRRQLLVESALLALTGATLGLVLARWLREALLWAAGNGEIVLDTSMDWRVAAFLACVLGAVVMIAGWAPAWSALRGGLHEGTKKRIGAKPVTFLRSGLIVAQMALSLLLLGGAGLLASSFRSVLREETGFAKGLLFVSPDLVNAGVAKERMPESYARLLEAVRRLPGVQGAAWISHVPLSGTLRAYTVESPAAAEISAKERLVMAQEVTDGYFRAAGVSLLAGNDFRQRGASGPRQTIISESLAKRLFGSVHRAVGQRLKPGSQDWTEVVGVAADAKYHTVWEDAPHTVYTCYWDMQKTNGMTLAIRQEGASKPLLAAVRGLLQQQAGRMPYLRVTSVAENVAGSARTERMLAWLLGGFGLFALLISVTGIAGLLGYAVQLRRKEIGIRIALGASPSGVAQEFARNGLLLAMAGVIAGLFLSWWLRKTVTSFLFRVEATEPLVWVSVIVLLIVCAMLGAAIPARRASQLQAIEVLRAE